MMKTLVHCLAWLAAVVMVFLWVPVAEAHPLGNFTINHYAGLHVSAHEIDIDYVLDMAEIPAFQEINQIDLNHDRKADSTETIRYPTDKCREASAHLTLRHNQKPLPLTLRQATIQFPPGVGGLDTLRLTCDFRGLIRAAIGNKDANSLIEFEDNFYPQRLGWREITVTTENTPLQGGFEASSISKRLTMYPDDLLSSPPNQRQVAFEVNPSLGEPSVRLSEPSNLGQTLAGRNNDVFTGLITLENPNFFTILLALTIAFVWGGLHALSPGHGKTVVGAYLVGSRSKFQHALLLGLTVTLTHTAGIFVLGLVALGTSHLIVTEQLYPWLSGLSGVLMTGIGLNLLISRLRTAQVFQGELEHSHDHNHHHDYDHSTTHAAEHSHHHAEHAHDHSWGHTHSHLPPSVDGSSITWSSILALGISGGLLPCPSALVVLLSAIALGRIGFGLALVSAFSLGLAGTLTGIGLVLVYAKGVFERLPLQVSRGRLFPATSALLVTLIGLGITTKALLTHTL